MSRKHQRVLLVFLLFPFLAWPQEGAGYWVTKPADGTLSIIGVSNRRLGREGELESAREDAAQKLLLYHGAKVTARTVLASASQASVETTLEPLFAGDYEALKQSLAFDREKDVYRTDGAVFVRFACPAPGQMGIDYAPTVFAGGQPQWTRRPVQGIAGYITGVGFSGPRRYVKDAVAKSCENAAAALIVSLSAQIETRDGDSHGRGAASRIAETAEGELSGFMVLEMWVDPKTKAVWTLAAARKTN